MSFFRRVRDYWSHSWKTTAAEYSSEYWKECSRCSLRLTWTTEWYLAAIVIPLVDFLYDPTKIPSCGEYLIQRIHSK